MERHFTVSGFLSHDGRTALHWHRLGMWLPPGGHIEARTRTPSRRCFARSRRRRASPRAIVGATAPYPHAQPRQLPPPVTIGVYDIERDAGTPAPHQHIDLVYFTRPASSGAPALPDNDEGWRWVASDELREPGVALAGPGGTSVVAEDVRLLALDAIEAVAALYPSAARV